MGLEWDPEGDRERRREGRGRLLTTIAIVAGIGVFAVTRIARHQEEQRRQHQLDELSRSYVAPSAYPTYEPPPASTDELATTARDVCRRLLTCNGLAEADVTRELDACISTQTRMATDQFATGVLVSAYKAVLATCGALPCEKFNACYLDTLKDAAGPAAPGTPLSAETRAQLVAEICAVAQETPGKVPDLAGPTASPRAKRLATTLSSLDPATMSELMKQAIASCAPAK